MTLVPVDDYRIFCVRDVLSADECRGHIELAEELGFDVAPITTSAGFVVNAAVRDNSRVILDSAELAGLFWERVREFVPTPLFGWEAVGLNERFRYYRYDPGQKFRPHFDGAFARNHREKSLLTLMVYLNDGYAGGQTKFDTDRRRVITPEAGMALAFWHQQLHEGAPVEAGRKYVLRTDVMYRRPPAPGQDS
jgi:prolyl 4-hydroxylase